MIRVPGEHLLEVALANQSRPTADQIAVALARMCLGAAISPRPLRSEIRLPKEKLDVHAGQYQLAPGFVMKVWRDGRKPFPRCCALRYNPPQPLLTERSRRDQC